VNNYLAASVDKDGKKVATYGQMCVDTDSCDLFNKHVEQQIQNSKNQEVDSDKFSSDAKTQLLAKLKK